jgi:hypothetical protein
MWLAWLVVVIRWHVVKVEAPESLVAVVKFVGSAARGGEAEPSVFRYCTGSR